MAAAHVGLDLSGLPSFFLCAATVMIDELRRPQKMAIMQPCVADYSPVRAGPVSLWATSNLRSKGSSE